MSMVWSSTTSGGRALRCIRGVPASAEPGRAAVLRRYPFTMILKAGEPAEEADAAAAQDRPRQQDHGARRGQRRDWAGGLGRGTRPIGASR